MSNAPDSPLWVESPPTGAKKLLGRPGEFLERLYSPLYRRAMAWSRHQRAPLVSGRHEFRGVLVFSGFNLFTSRLHLLGFMNGNE